MGNEARRVKGNRLAVLLRLKLFRLWDRKFISNLTSHILLRTYKKGSYLYKAGDFNNYIYIVTEGEVEIVVDNEHSKMTKRNGVCKYYVHRALSGKQEDVLLKIAPNNYFGDEGGYGITIKRFSAKVASNECSLFLIPFDVDTETKLQKIDRNAGYTMIQQMKEISKSRMDLLVKRIVFLNDSKKMKEIPSVGSLPKIPCISSKQETSSAIKTSSIIAIKRNLKRLTHNSRVEFLNKLMPKSNGLVSSYRKNDKDHLQNSSYIFLGKKEIAKRERVRTNIESATKIIPHAALIDRSAFSLRNLKKLSKSTKKLLETDPNESLLITERAYFKEPKYLIFDSFKKKAKDLLISAER